MKAIHEFNNKIMEKEVRYLYKNKKPLRQPSRLNGKKLLNESIITPRYVVERGDTFRKMFPALSYKLLTNMYICCTVPTSFPA